MESNQAIDDIVQNTGEITEVSKMNEPLTTKNTFVNLFRGLFKAKKVLPMKIKGWPRGEIKPGDEIR